MKTILTLLLSCVMTAAIANETIAPNDAPECITLDSARALVSLSAVSENALLMKNEALLHGAPAKIYAGLLAHPNPGTVASMAVFAVVLDVTPPGSPEKKFSTVGVSLPFDLAGCHIDPTGKRIDPSLGEFFRGINAIEETTRALRTVGQGV